MYFIVACFNLIIVLTSLLVSYYRNPDKRYKFLINLLNWMIIFTPNLYFLNYEFKLNYNSNLQIFIISVLQFIVWNIVLEIYFYSFHKIVHEKPILYKLIHKLHHSGTPNCVLDAQWANPLETLLIVLPSYWLWPFLMELIIPGSITHHVLIFMSLLSSLDTIKNHIGLDNFHMKHHLNVKYNFGTIGFIDYIFNTNFK